MFILEFQCHLLFIRPVSQLMYQKVVDAFEYIFRLSANERNHSTCTNKGIIELKIL